MVWKHEPQRQPKPTNTGMYKKHKELLINWKHFFQKEGGNYTQESAKPWQKIQHGLKTFALLNPYTFSHSFTDLQWNIDIWNPDRGLILFVCYLCVSTILPHIHLLNYVLHKLRGLNTSYIYTFGDIGSDVTGSNHVWGEVKWLFWGLCAVFLGHFYHPHT